MAATMIRIGTMLLLVTLAAPVAAQSVDDDVRCLLASNYFAQTEKDPRKGQVARMASAFYLGRLDARISSAQLKTAVPAMAKTMATASAGPIMNACVRRLLEKGVFGPPAPPPAKPR